MVVKDGLHIPGAYLAHLHAMQRGAFLEGPARAGYGAFGVCLGRVLVLPFEPCLIGTLKCHAASLYVKGASAVFRKGDVSAEAVFEASKDVVGRVSPFVDAGVHPDFVGPAALSRQPYDSAGAIWAAHGFSSWHKKSVLS